MRVLERLVVALRSPSITTLARSPRSNSAGHTRLPTFSIIRTDSRGGFSAANTALQHIGVEMAPGPGIDLHRIASGGADAGGVGLGCLIAFDHPDREPAAEVADGPLEEVVFPAPGELIRFRARIPRPANQPRLRSASRLFLAIICRAQVTTAPCPW